MTELFRDFVDHYLNTVSSKSKPNLSAITARGKSKVRNASLHHNEIFARTSTPPSPTNLMIDKLFIDTAGFFALSDKNDTFHKRGKDFSKSLEIQTKIFTSESVLVETFSNIQYHLGSKPAREFLHAILSGESGIEAIIPTSEDLFASYRILKKYPDQKFSLVDSISFILMERLKIWNVFTFDRHFSIYRSKGRHFQIFPH
ncbi:MAG: PIN domain-containing protein [Elusimicrobia bacterium]|nr:PIN domain-containing protein [Elusimicrobiota bacterium]